MNPSESASELRLLVNSSDVLFNDLKNKSNLNEQMNYNTINNDNILLDDDKIDEKVSI